MFTPRLRLIGEDLEAWSNSKADGMDALRAGTDSIAIDT